MRSSLPLYLLFFLDMKAVDLLCNNFAFRHLLLFFHNL